MARTEAPQDPRQYVRVAIDLPLNPKLAILDNPAAGWAYVVSICYCGQSTTDGHFPLVAALRLAGVDKDVAESLVEQGLWHLPGHDCDSCPQPKPGHAYVHDYLQHQRSADEVRDLTSKRREAGRKGAAQRWSKPKEAPEDATESVANAIANAMANGEQTDGNAMAEKRREEEIYKDGALKRAQRGTRIPEEFSVTGQMRAWAREKAPLVDLGLQTSRFVLHWQSASKNATKLDWVKTWQNWMLGEQEKAARYQARASPTSSAPDRIAADERCPEHKDQRAGNCRHCAARAKAGVRR